MRKLLLFILLGCSVYADGQQLISAFTSTFPYSNNTLIWINDFTPTNDSILIDKSGKGNNVYLTQSYCGTAKVGTLMTFTTPLTGLLGTWTMTYQGTAIAVLALDKITFSGAGTIYDLRITNGSTTYYYPISENGLTVYDCSGNGNHITVTVSTIDEWIANKQNKFHYNYVKGGNKNSSEIITNGGFESTFSSGLASGWANFNTITRAEENDTVHSGLKAQKITGNTGQVIYQNKPIRANYTYYISAWVFSISGKGYISVSAGGLNDRPVQTYLSTVIGQWEHLTYAFRAASNTTINIRVGCLDNGSQIIIDDVSVYSVSPTISIPSLLTGSNDALGRVKQFTGLRHSETSIKLPYNSILRANDVDSLFFSSTASKNVELKSLPFVTHNLTYNNKIYFDAEFLYFSSLSANKTKSLLNRFSKPIYYAQQTDINADSFNFSISHNVVSVNRNFALAFDNYQYINWSNDYGKTWSGNYNWGTTVPLTYHITSKGTIILVTPNNKIYRSINHAVSFVEIIPKDLSGNNIVPHTPTNATYPGNYYAPYARIYEYYNPADSSNMLVWGNWGNTGRGANPSNCYYSADDGATIKTFYAFGQNLNYTDNGTVNGGTGGTVFGNALNPIITRHVHDIKYRNGKYYCVTGDAGTNNIELHIFEFIYNKIADTWSAPTELLTIPTQRQRILGFDIDTNGWIYYASDGSQMTINQGGINYNSDGVYKCLLTDINDLSKHTLLDTCNMGITVFYKNDNIIMWSPPKDLIVGSSRLKISNNYGQTWIEVDLSSMIWYVWPGRYYTYINSILANDKEDYYLRFFSPSAIKLSIAK